MQFEQLARQHAPRVLGVLARRHRDFAAAEDAVQEALLAAFRQWPESGVPDDPAAWLLRVATRRLTDAVRGEVARQKREAATGWQTGYVAPALEPESGEDDTLVLLFLCCHPALTQASAIALTLRAVGGLTTAEIAHAFLVPEATMAQRISRAKQTIQKSGVAFRLPSRSERAERLRAVLHVLYLIFNEGYTASSGESLQRVELATEAIRLTRLLRESLPESGEATGLLALMLLTDARRASRNGPAGELIPLAEQDRSLWDRAQIAEGVALVSAALTTGPAGSYQLQAAIAALHDEATTAEETDWAQILALYEVLRQLSDNPMVLLSHAVATAMVFGVPAGLARLDELAPRLGSHFRFLAVRAHLLELDGDVAGAIEAYRAAAQGTASVPEQNYLRGKAARLVG